MGNRSKMFYTSKKRLYDTAYLRRNTCGRSLNLAGASKIYLERFLETRCTIRHRSDLRFYIVSLSLLIFIESNVYALSHTAHNSNNNNKCLVFFLISYRLNHSKLEDGSFLLLLDFF